MSGEKPREYQELDRHYRVYVLCPENPKSIDMLIADAEHNSPIATPYEENNLAEMIILEHSEAELSPFEYLSFSFEPRGQIGIYDGEIVRPRKLTEQEQRHFLKDLQSRIRAYHDLDGSCGTWDDREADEDGETQE